MAMTLPRGHFTNAIAGVTVAAFLLVMISGYGDLANALGGFIPARVQGLVQFSGLPVPPVPVWLTPLTATLLHGGWMHLAFNMITLVYCARFVEYLLGGWRLLLLYVVGAYAATAAQWAAGPASVDPMIGASGAISAVIGTYAVVFSQREVKPIGPIPASVVRIVWMAMGWTILQLLIGLAGIGGGGPLGSIAIWAHIGGFVAGLILARPLLRWRFHKKGPRLVQ